MSSVSSLVQLPDQCGDSSPLWTYTSSGESIDVLPPVAEIDGRTVNLAAALKPLRTHRVSPKIEEHVFCGRVIAQPTVRLTLVVRTAEDTAVVRFRYELDSDEPCRLTKGDDGQELFRLARLKVDEQATEVRLSDYNSMVHSYVPTAEPLSQSDFANQRAVMGPLLVWSTAKGHSLIAYEHGSQYPDAYLSYVLSESDGSAFATLAGSKGSYLSGSDLRQGYRTVWMHLVSTHGPLESLQEVYRNFILHSLSASPASRQPYIFYNTWNNQERIHNWSNRPYLDDMNESRMLSEVDAAHDLGVEVFVMDTGWYEATGDWRVSMGRFPNGLGPIKGRLEKYGMKLGLWFGPTSASVSSSLYSRNKQNRRSWKGSYPPTKAIWETEESAEFCLVSSYADDFAEELIRCAEELGVRYFKWDAVDQYGCDDPHHQHGDSSHTPDERAAAYAFRQPLALVRIVERLCAAVPDSIVDFDVTEYDRCFGLAFLSVGKYFLINNGPYLHNYDVPRDKDVSFKNNNLFFYPGPARDWICRTPLTFDAWIPSVLFLVHYLPDGPESNQNMTVGSLILGHNGIWGDLIGLSHAAKKYIRQLLVPYKQIRNDAAAVALHRTGQVGSMIETYQKINPATGRGFIVIFANVTMQTAMGDPRPVRQPIETEIVTTTKAVRAVWHTPNAHVHFDRDGKAVIKGIFTKADAAIVYFGVQDG